MITTHVNDFINHEKFESSNEIPYFYTDANDRPPMQLPPRFAFYDNNTRIPVPSSNGSYNIIKSRKYNVQGTGTRLPLLSDTVDLSLPIRSQQSDSTDYPTLYNHGETLFLTAYDRLIFSKENKVELIDNIFVQRVNNDIIVSSENDFYVDVLMDNYEVSIPNNQWLPKSEMNFPTGYVYNGWEPAPDQTNRTNFSTTSTETYIPCVNVNIAILADQSLLDFMNINVSSIQNGPLSITAPYTQFYIHIDFFTGTTGVLLDYLCYLAPDNQYISFAGCTINYNFPEPINVFALPHITREQVPNRNFINIPFGNSTIGEIDIYNTTIKFKDLFFRFDINSTKYSVTNLMFTESYVFELLNLQCYISGELGIHKIRDLIFFDASDNVIKPFFLSSVKFDNQIDSFYSSIPVGCSSILSIPFYYNTSVRRVRKIKFTDSIIKIHGGYAYHEYGRCRLYRNDFCHLKAGFPDQIKITTASNGDFYKFGPDTQEEIGKLVFNGTPYQTRYTLGNYLYLETSDKWNNMITITSLNSSIPLSSIVYDPNNVYNGQILPFLRIWIENQALAYQYEIAPNVFRFPMSGSEERVYKKPVSYLRAYSNGNYHLETSISTFGNYDIALEGFKQILILAFNVTVLDGTVINNSPGYPIIIVNYIIEELDLKEQTIFMHTSVNNNVSLNSIINEQFKCDFDTEQYGHHDTLLQIVSGNNGYEFAKIGKWAHVDNNCNFVMNDFIPQSVNSNILLISNNNFNNNDNKFRQRINNRNGQKTQPDIILYAYNESSVSFEGINYNRPNIGGTVLQMLTITNNREIHIYWGNYNFKTLAIDNKSVTRKYYLNNSYHINQKIETPITKKVFNMIRSFPENVFTFRGKKYYFYIGFERYNKFEISKLGIINIDENAIIKKIYTYLLNTLQLTDKKPSYLNYFTDNFYLLVQNEDNIVKDFMSHIYYSETKLGNLNSDKYKLNITNNDTEKIIYYNINEIDTLLGTIYTMIYRFF